MINDDNNNNHHNDVSPSNDYYYDGNNNHNNNNDSIIISKQQLIQENEELKKKLSAAHAMILKQKETMDRLKMQQKRRLQRRRRRGGGFVDHHPPCSPTSPTSIIDHHHRMTTAAAAAESSSLSSPSSCARLATSPSSCRQKSISLSEEQILLASMLPNIHDEPINNNENEEEDVRGHSVSMTGLVSAIVSQQTGELDNELSSSNLSSSSSSNSSSSSYSSSSSSSSSEEGEHEEFLTAKVDVVASSAKNDVLLPDITNDDSSSSNGINNEIFYNKDEDEGGVLFLDLSNSNSTELYNNSFKSLPSSNGINGSSSSNNNNNNNNNNKEKEEEFITADVVVASSSSSSSNIEEEEDAIITAEVAVASFTTAEATILIYNSSHDDDDDHPTRFLPSFASSIGINPDNNNNNNNTQSSDDGNNSQLADDLPRLFRQGTPIPNTPLKKPSFNRDSYSVGVSDSCSESDGDSYNESDSSEWVSSSESDDSDDQSKDHNRNNTTEEEVGPMMKENISINFTADDENTTRKNDNTAWINRRVSSKLPLRSKNRRRRRRPSKDGTEADKPRMVFASPVRGLPRERSIELHSDDDISICPSPPQGLGRTLEVSNHQVIDAMNKRGLYTGLLDRKTFLPDGYGTMEYFRGDEKSYTGDWKMGCWDGNGVLVGRNADDTYEGYFVKHKKHGEYGVFRFADGRIFHGEFYLDEMKDGKMTYLDGSYYNGLWEKGQRNHYGVYFFPDGITYYEGQWKDDKMHGQGSLHGAEKQLYTGDWYFGKQTGVGIELDKNGNVFHQGNFIDGLPVPDQPVTAVVSTEEDKDNSNDDEIDWYEAETVKW